MNKEKIIHKTGYHTLISDIGKILQEGRKHAFYAVNTILVKTYWEIGKQIVKYEQKGKERAEYGSTLLDNLSKDLKIKYGKGFSRRNLLDMRRFYCAYPIRQTLSAKLSWSHYVELIGIEDDLSRHFYEKQSMHENWSVRELKRQINSALFQRIALSKDEKGVLELSKKGQVIEKAEDVVKDPYIFEFLDLPENHKHSEKEFEQNLIENLQMFLLELGKGFTFVKRQYRITLDNEHYYTDLVFYHKILRCYVLIDLKIGKVTHHDIGQMNMYLNYFKKEENAQGDNEPVGIIICADKNNFLVEYALGGISNKMFISKYSLYLPKRKELEQKLECLLYRK
ncbi:DUF1016 family protein [Candidatus Woesearchaeota archaeon]|nr:DUF1016 family protein [Candidatus Woesearchaeota archaeon]